MSDTLADLFRKPPSRWDRRIPCVVFIWTNDAVPIAAGFTTTYRAAKRIERKVRRFHADVGMTEAWHWPHRARGYAIFTTTDTSPSDGAQEGGRHG